VSKDSAPFFIVHGDKDDLVPISQSQRLAEALSKAGVEGGSVNEWEGQGGNLDQFSRVQCVVDWFGPLGPRDHGRRA
jgi:acetyl esterase/lipase